MFRKRAAFVLLLHAHICLTAGIYFGGNNVSLKAIPKQLDLAKNMALAVISKVFFEEYKDTANWCPSIHPGECYTNTKNICPKFCMEHKKSIPNCDYGDHNRWCAPKYCGDIRGNCCETCPKFKCTDDADWCGRIQHRGECYDPQTEKTCCYRCNQLRTGPPACRYGDLIRWCTQQQCLNTDAPRCCATCPVPESECKDHAPWCPSLFPGDCYNKQTEQTCCKFCKDHRQDNNPRCRYGDQNTWCAPEFCWDVRRINCCVTCPITPPYSLKALLQLFLLK